ncbi:MAG: hypothetical protein JRE58_10475 [Deltaproteobacteria bacterium]|nr:hypothetical protein [Deltaproteobacteria bacterium]
MFKNSNAYKLNTSFSFHEPVETVWDEIITFENWPSWWVGLDRVENLHRSESVKGNMYKAVIKGYVPYGLSFYACVDEVVPLSMISTKVHGDLEGEGVCRFLEKNNRTRLSFDWNVKPTKLWMKILSPVAHSYFVRNHDKILDNGFEGLIKKLKIKQIANGAK